jgi:O-antigen ligase
MFFWGFVQFVKRKKVKIVGYLLVAVTILAAMYTFSRAGYLAILFSVFVLGVLKDRKLLVVLGVFLLVWQSVVPTAVRERVNMTKNSNGKLEASAQERVDLWENAERSILSSPIVGSGYATFQLGDHVDNLKDTHNWYVKILVETGFVGLIMAFFLLQQLISLSFRLFRRASDPLYRGLGLGLLLATCACIVSNCFGDRWTYVEIMGLFWVLAGTAIRATELSDSAAAVEPGDLQAIAATDAYMAYR